MPVLGGIDGGTRALVQRFAATFMSVTMSSTFDVDTHWRPSVPAPLSQSHIFFCVQLRLSSNVCRPRARLPPSITLRLPCLSLNESEIIDIISEFFTQFLLM